LRFSFTPICALVAERSQKHRYGCRPDMINIHKNSCVRKKETL
jgi:hypothetical protein